MSIDRVWKKLSSPFDWSMRARRLVMLTFPVSVPLWLLAIFAMSLLKCMAEVAKPIMRFWNAPRRRRSSYYGYGHQRRHSGRPLQLVAEGELPVQDAAMFDQPRAAEMGR